MRGKDKHKRQGIGYTNRWLRHRIQKQKERYESRIKRLKEKIKEIKKNHNDFILELRKMLRKSFKIHSKVTGKQFSFYHEKDKQKIKEQQKNKAMKQKQQENLWEFISNW